jgi:hypothetical protein
MSLTNNIDLSCLSSSQIVPDADQIQNLSKFWKNNKVSKCMRIVCYSIYIKSLESDPQNYKISDFVREKGHTSKICFVERFCSF